MFDVTATERPPEPVLSPMLVKAAVEAALAEDLGLSGDITTNATINPGAMADAVIAARSEGIVSGGDLARASFQALDPDVLFEQLVDDGSPAISGQAIARVSGRARALLTGERVALNFLGRMSGVASLTRKYVDAVAGLPVKIVDTRKTTPGLRAFEKYAVRCGGGFNHRTGLFDAVLIKDNHIAAAGDIATAIAAARAAVGHLVKIEIECDTLDQLDEILSCSVDVILLDNMTTKALREAVRRIGGRCIAEASGGVNLQTVRAIGETGVDLISVGALTHSAAVLDVGLDFAPGERVLRVGRKTA